MAAWYNEIDPYAAQWLRNLIAAGHIAAGDVDERSIVDVRASDLDGYDQCHFFAGIGGWSVALRLAGWPDDRPVWTGSCPCQPFSAAGKGGGFDDARHLWPEWSRLIRERRPSVVFGEQVASKAGLAWLDLVRTDMETAGYAFAAFDLCSAGVGAPHIRQRLGFVADADGGNTSAERLQRSGEHGLGPQDASVGERLADATSSGRREKCADARGQSVGDYPQGDAERLSNSSGDLRPGPTNGFWSNPDWLLCRDGKWRPVESGTFPLAHGVSARVGRLRAYGNAINPHQFAHFIRAYLETRP